MFQPLRSSAFAEGVEHSWPRGNLHVDVYSSFVCHCQNMEATKTPPSSRGNKYTVSLTEDGRSSSATKRRAAKPRSDPEEPQTHCEEGRAAVRKGCPLTEPESRTFRKGGAHGGGGKVLVRRNGVAGGGSLRRAEPLKRWPHATRIHSPDRTH